MKDNCKVSTFWCYQRRLVADPWALSVDVIRCRGHDACERGCCLSIVVYQAHIKPKGASVDEYIRLKKLSDFAQYMRQWFDELGIDYTTSDLLQLQDFIYDVFAHRYKFDDDFLPDCKFHSERK